MLTKEQKRTALAEFRMESDDPWGSAMSHLFGIADILYHVDGVPYHWEYRHGAFNHDPIAEWHGNGHPCPRASEDYPTECQCQWPDCQYVPFIEAGDTGIEMLTYAGNVLNHYLAFVKRAGLDY